MSVVTTLLVASTAVTYVAALFLIVRGRWTAYAGSRPLHIAAVLTFVLARFYPQSAFAAMAASIVLAVALLIVTRRSSLLGAVLAAVPLVAMLLTVDRTFFGGSTAQQFQDATIAVLCIPGPVSLVAWFISLSRQTPNYPTTSSR